MSDIAESPTPTEAPAATPASQGPSSAPAGTASPSGSEATGGAPSEGTFFSGDPSTLPPELKPAYENMLKDYKAKTQSIAESKKKAEAYDQISKDQRFVEYWNGLNRQQKADLQDQKQEAVKRLADRVSPEEFQKAFSSPEEFMAFLEKANQYTSETYQKKISDLEQKLSVKEAQDIVESFASEQGPDGKPLRSDFFKMDEDQLISGYLRLNSPDKGYSQKEYSQKLDEAYQWAKATTQKYYEMGKSEALKIIQQKAATSTNPPTRAAKGAYTGPDPKKITPFEALQMAKRGERVPQDY